MSTLAPTVVKMTRNEAKILAHYGAGESAQQIVDNTGLPYSDVCLALDALAGNNRERAHTLAIEWQKRAQAVAAARGVSAPPAPQPVPVPAPTPPKTYEKNIDGIADMLDAAEHCGSDRLGRAARKIREQLTALQRDLADHSREAKLRDEQTQLEARLAEIRAQLKPKRGPAAPASDLAPADVDSKTVRAWAAENGYQCPRTGRVPGDVVAAYRKAAAA